MTNTFKVGDMVLVKPEVAGAAEGVVLVVYKILPPNILGFKTMILLRTPLDVPIAKHFRKSWCFAYNEDLELVPDE